MDAFSQSFSPFRLPQRLGDRKPSTDSDLKAGTTLHDSDTEAWARGAARAPPVTQRLSTRGGPASQRPAEHPWAPPGSERLRAEACCAARGLGGKTTRRAAGSPGPSAAALGQRGGGGHSVLGGKQLEAGAFLVPQPVALPRPRQQSLLTPVAYKSVSSTSSHKTRLCSLNGEQTLCTHAFSRSLWSAKPVRVGGYDDVTLRDFPQTDGRNDRQTGGLPGCPLAGLHALAVACGQ